MDYGVYQPLYEKLLERIPTLCGPNELFQFVLPTKAARWDDIRDERMYHFLDSVSSKMLPFFMESDLRYSSVYASYLAYLNAVHTAEYKNKICSCIDAFTGNCSTVYRLDGSVRLKPAISLSGCLKEDIEQWESETDTCTFSESFSYSTREAEYHYHISICGIGCYEIQRGAWFDESLLYLPERDENPMFSPLKLLPVRILVIHKLVSYMQIRFLAPQRRRFLQAKQGEEAFIPADHDTSILGVSSKLMERITGGNENG